MEAMASSVPVIATAVGGNCELVADGVTGRLVPPADPSALAEAILGYFHDEPMRVRHAQAGRTGVLQSFTLSRMVTDYDSLYERLLVQRGLSIQRMK